MNLSFPAHTPRWPIQIGDEPTNYPSRFTASNLGFSKVFAGIPKLGFAGRTMGVADSAFIERVRAIPGFAASRRRLIMADPLFAIPTFASLIGCMHTIA